MTSTHVPTPAEAAAIKEYNVHKAQQLLEAHILSKLVGLSRMSMLSRVTLNLVQEGIRLNNPLHCAYFRQLRDDLINSLLLRGTVSNALQAAIQMEGLPFGCQISIDGKETIIILVRLSKEAAETNGEG